MITWAERAKAAISQDSQIGTAKTDETAVSRVLAVSSVPTVAISVASDPLSSVLTVPSLGILKKHDSSIEENKDLDRWCWPHSTAMNGAEIDLFATRLRRFSDRGVVQLDAETMADKLVLRDRESDERRLCLECAHLGGYGASSWRCGNWQAAGVALLARDAQLTADLVLQLQSCAGFTMPAESKPYRESEVAPQD